MKKLFRLAFIAVFTICISSGIVQAQTVIDTNFGAFQNVYLDSLGQSSLVLDTNSYNTKKDLVFFSRSSFDCSDIGDSISVLVRIRDTSVTPPNTYFMRSLKIWNVDSIAPFLALKDTTTIYLKPNGSAKLFFSDVDSASWDSCGISISGFQVLTQTDFFCSDAGYKTVSIKVPDSYGNVRTGSTILHIVDTIKPTLNVVGDTVFLSGNPLSAQISFSDINSSSTDNCALDSALLNGQSVLTFGCGDAGLNKIGVSLFDVNGNEQSDSLEFYVIDTLGFNYTKHPYTAYLDGDSVSVWSDSIVTISSGGCFPPVLTVLSDTAFSCADVASNPNYIKFTLVSGPQMVTDSVAIMVLDTIKPTLQTLSDTLFFTSSGLSISFTDLDNGSSDNCGLDSATVNGQSVIQFACADTGLQQVQVVLYDVNGNSSLGSVDLFLVDTIQPYYTVSAFDAYLVTDTVLVSRGDVLDSLSGGCSNSAQFTWISDTGLTCADVTSNPNYLKFAISTSGLQLIDSVPVTVFDTISPVVVLKSDTVFLSGSPLSASLVFADVDNGSFNNCGIDSVLVNGADSVAFSCSSIGLNKLFVQVFDVNGNQSSDSAYVYVLDTIQPTYITNPQTVYLLGDSIAVPVDSIIGGLTGGCTQPQLTLLSDTVFTCADVLSNPNYVKFEVSNGTVTLIDSVAVTVLDTVSPNLQLQGDTLVLTSNGYTLTFSDIDNGSSDNCSIDSAQVNGSNQVYFGCGDTGSATITVLLFDASGNSTLDSVDVYVVDTLSPGYTKTPFTAYLQSDTILVSRVDILTNVTGGCGSSLTLSILSDTVFTCTDVSSNPHFIQFSITTTGFNILDSVLVTVLDTLPPSLTVANDTLYLSGNPLSASLSFADIDQGSTDNCGIDSVTVNGDNQLLFTCADTGQVEISVAAFDASLNVANDTISVWVIDTIPPSYTINPYTAHVGTASVTVPIDSLVQNVSAGCFPPQINVLSDTVFDCMDISSNPNYVHFTISAAGITKLDSVPVTVLDTVKPVLQIPVSDTIVIFGNSIDISFADIDQGSTDNCGLDSALLNGVDTLTLTCNDIGVNNLSVTLYDESGNVSTGTIALFVEDTVSPGYTKTPYTANLIGNSVTVSRSDILTNVTAGCSGGQSSLTILSDTIFDCADIAFNPNFVHFSVTAGGFTVFDSVAVTVVDTTSPTFTTKPPQTVYLDTNGVKVLQPFDLLVGAPQDNCSIDSIAITPPQLTCSNVGQFAPVAIQVWDGNGNSTTKFMFVLAVDSIDPKIVTKQAVVELDSATGTFALTQADVVQSLSDNCGIATTTITPNLFSCADTGWVQVTITSVDVNGNSATAQTQVYVSDSIAPHFIPITGTVNITLDASGIANIGLSDLILGNAFDACVIVDTTISPSQFTCADAGVNPVSLKLVDANGNADSANYIVQVFDNIAPTVIPKNITINLDSNGQASITLQDVLDTAFDNCGLNLNASSVTPSNFNCTNVGQQLVSISVADVNGNTTPSSALVTVIGASGSKPTFTGPQTVCKNAYHVRYVVTLLDSNADYVWLVDTTKARVLTTAFKGREAYIEFFGDGSTDILVTNEFASSCFSDTATLAVNISGEAPPVAEIKYWNEVTKTMLVISDNSPNFYQWGYDRWVGGSLVSDTLLGETKASYYNTNIASNIANQGFIYWCQTSFDGACWNRSYFPNYPVEVEENEIPSTTVWPNPFDQIIRIESNRSIEKIELYDLSGALIRAEHTGLESGILELNNLQSLPPSTYLLVLKYVDGSATNHKIVRVE